MYGAILGDIIGSPYEFDGGGKTKDFPLFSGDSEFTDDTVMTIAVANAFYQARNVEDDDWRKNHLVSAARYRRLDSAKLKPSAAVIKPATATA